VIRKKNHGRRDQLPPRFAALPFGLGHAVKKRQEARLGGPIAAIATASSKYPMQMPASAGARLTSRSNL
jgi:hypothetical protein